MTARFPIRIRNTRSYTAPTVRKDYQTTSFYSRWVLACAAGELVGIGVAAVVGLVMNEWVGEPQSFGGRVSVLTAFAVVGGIEGGGLGAFQWLALRTKVPRLRAGEWLTPTACLAVVGWIAGMAPSVFANQDVASSKEPPLGVILLMAAAIGAGAGLCFGAVQWFVLRRHCGRAGRWILIHVPAWACAMTAIFLGASLPTAEWSGFRVALAGAAGGVLGGILLGAITGLVARDLTAWVDEHNWSLQGKICAVTGANSGIGFEIARGLARLGGFVILLCRRPDEGERARSDILKELPLARVAVVSCDLGRFSSVRNAAAQISRQWPQLDVLVHNAGSTYFQRTLTADGVEATLAVDAVSPFLLTALLREHLERCGARIVTLTGIYHRKGHVDFNDLHFASRPYDWLAANNQAQRARFMLMSELARRAPRLMTAAVHPGAVLTRAQSRLPWLVRSLIHTMFRPAFVRPEVGAIPVLRLAASPNLQDPAGRFFDRCRAAPDLVDASLAQSFFAACEEMTGERWHVS